MDGDGSVGGGADPPGGGVGVDSLGYQLNLAARSARACFERRLAEIGGSFATWAVLETLATRGPMIQAGLAEALCVRGPTVTRQVDRMIADDLVVRRRVAADRRVIEIGLTEKGRRLHGRLAEAHQRANAQLAAGLSAGELRTLRGLLQRVQRNAAGPATGDCPHAAPPP